MLMDSVLIYVDSALILIKLLYQFTVLFESDL